MKTHDVAVSFAQLNKSFWFPTCVAQMVLCIMDMSSSAMPICQPNSGVTLFDGLYPNRQKKLKKFIQDNLNTVLIIKK